METPSCVISDCMATATSQFSVNDNGLLAVHAVCPVHLSAIQNGTMFAAPADPTRGFIGLREDNDTRGPL